MELINYIIENFSQYADLPIDQLPTFLQELVQQVADLDLFGNEGGSTTGFENLPESSTTGFNGGPSTGSN